MPFSQQLPRQAHAHRRAWVPPSTPADSAPRDLLPILQQQQALVKDLLAMAQEKHALILNREASRLAGLVSREAEAAEALARLEEERQAWGRRRGLDPDGSLEAWLEHLPVPERTTVAEAARQLQGLARSLAAQNAVNQALLQQELAYIQFAVNLLRGPDPADLTYGPPTLQGTAGAAHADAHGPAEPASPSPQGLRRSLFDFQA